MAQVNNTEAVPLNDNEIQNIATNSAVAIAGPPPEEINELAENGADSINESVMEPVTDASVATATEAESETNTEPMTMPDPMPVPAPVPVPMPMPVPRPMPPVSLPREIIVEEEITLKPNAPRLEEESFKEKMELIPVVRRSRKHQTKSPSKRTRKYKRCKKNHRRNTKTHRCNTKCPSGKKKNATNKRCVKKGGKKCKK